MIPIVQPTLHDFDQVVAEFRQACTYVCKGVDNCIWEKLQVQADLDDDGKEYKVVNA